jgi:UDP-N-acetylglucosamine transferase subunit ALG13
VTAGPTGQVPAADAPPLVVVTVGGDHHPFGRLMGWMTGWLATAGEGVRCVVQHGTATLPAGATGAPYLPHDELQRLIASARAVVSSGGPSTLSECLSAGIRPIVVPRLHSLGEAVDDHQRDFCRRMAAKGLAVVAEDETTLRDVLDKAVADASALRLDDPGERQREVARTVETLGALVDRLVDGTLDPTDRPTPRTSRRRVLDRLLRPPRRRAGHGSHLEQRGDGPAPTTTDATPS